MGAEVDDEVRRGLANGLAHLADVVDDSEVDGERQGVEMGGAAAFADDWQRARAGAVKRSQQGRPDEARGPGDGNTLAGETGDKGGGGRSRGYGHRRK